MAGGAGELDLLTPEAVAEKWAAATLEAAPGDWDDEAEIALMASVLARGLQPG